MTTRTMTDYLSAHTSLYDTYNSWCAGFTGDDLAAASLCPGWTVRDVIAHTIGVESVLDGWQPSTESPPPFNKMSEFAAQIADLDAPEVASAVAALTASRLAGLESMGADAADSASITPTGVKTYGDFLRIRVFDMWVHAHDIAVPLGLSLDAGGIAGEIALDEVVGALGYIVGRKVGLPDGMSAAIQVTGDVERDLAVAVDGKARVVESIANPDVATHRRPRDVHAARRWTDRPAGAHRRRARRLVGRRRMGREDGAHPRLHDVAATSAAPPTGSHRVVPAGAGQLVMPSRPTSARACSISPMWRKPCWYHQHSIASSLVMPSAPPTLAE